MPRRKLQEAKLCRFSCGGIPFVAYRLTEGALAMSPAQYLPSRRVEVGHIATEFVGTNGLKTITATMPNKAVTVLYPMETVIALWEHLRSINQLPDRSNLLDALVSGNEITEELEIPPFKLHVERSSAAAPLPLAELIKIRVGKVTVPVLFQNNEIYIADSEGLQIIEAPYTWIDEITPTESRGRILRGKGFSFKHQSLFYQDKLVYQVRARLWKDWVIIWDYFSSKGNIKARNLVRELAIESLKDKVDRAKNHKEGGREAHLFQGWESRLPDRVNS